MKDVNAKAKANKQAVEDIYSTNVGIKKSKNVRHEGFARGHPPYYWPRLSGLNFLDLTG